MSHPFPERCGSSIGARETQRFATVILILRTETLSPSEGGGQGGGKRMKLVFAVACLMSGSSDHHHKLALLHDRLRDMGKLIHRC